MDTRFKVREGIDFVELRCHLGDEISDRDLGMLLDNGYFTACEEPDWEYMCRLDYYYYALDEDSREFQTYVALRQPSWESLLHGCPIRTNNGGML